MVSKRFAAGLAGLTLVGAAACAVVQSPPTAGLPADAGMARIPGEARAHHLPRRPAIDATPADLARFAEEVLVEAGIRQWALAVIHEGRLVERRFSAGVSDAGQTIDGATLFLEPDAKPVIAWGVTALAEAGLVDLDQPIEQYLSRWRLPTSDFDHRGVTVRRVLNHTAGLSWGLRRQPAAGEARAPIEELLSGTDAEGRRLEVIAEPGTRPIYSNGGYMLLQLLIEEVSGRPFAEFMDDEVLGPLGMHHSVFEPVQPRAPVTREVDALGRVVEPEGRVVTAFASSLITSLDDLGAFVLAHLQNEGSVPRGGGVLRGATLDSMLTPVPAPQSRFGLGYALQRLNEDLLVAGHGGGGGDFRLVQKTGDGVVILTNSTVGDFPIERIQCVWFGWLTGTEERCPVQSSYALLGAYGSGGVAAALDYYEELVDRADPDYVVGIEQLSDLARLLVGAGVDVDAAAIYRYISRPATPEVAIYGEVAERLLSGQRVPENRLPRYVGEYRSSSGDTIRLERAGAGVRVTIDPVAGIGGPVRMLTNRVFLFDLGGSIGELVFDLAESGAATSVTVRESAFGISLTAERSGVGATEARGCAVVESPPQAAEEVRARTDGREANVLELGVSAGAAPDSFVVAGGVRLHYLDFGGQGLPVVFVHSEAWDAHTYADFAPRFADRNRVLAVTRPGYGASEPHPDGFGVEVQARSLIDFLDAKGIERAVFAGNASATAELTVLGEHHADRVAGLIYFTGLAVPWLEEHDSDPTRAFEMFLRASPGAGDAAERERARSTYRPEHLLADRPTIPVPALAFVARSGTMGQERGIGALALVGSSLMEDVRSRIPSSPVRDHLERLANDESYRTRQLAQIDDPETQAFFLRLAANPELQEEMYRYHEDVVLPALRGAQERFRGAFGDDLRLVRLDVDQVVGYEYRDAPELIEHHIRRFLAEIDDARSVDEGRRAVADRSGALTILDAPGIRRAVAEANDNRQTAGRLLDGELRVELEAVETEWYPRGPEGPRIVTPAFAEPGRAPQAPGPLIRAAAGTPVRVSVRNTLDRAITVRGLLDRATMSPVRPDDADPLDADFFFADSLVVPPGETREARFTPTAEVSSFYYGRLASEEGGFAQPFLPGNYGDEGIFLGGFVVDPSGSTAPPDERVFLISRWAGRDEPSTLAITFKFMINGLSWPSTERLSYEVGDTVRWRLINTSAITHPMHLHGFYFTVDARGDTDSDTIYAPESRQQVVTDVMPDFSSLQLTWVPERPGNWLFHCHLIRHMGALQRFGVEGEPGHHALDGPMDPMEMDGMAGLVMGLNVADTDEAEDAPPERTIHLWTSRTPGVLGAHPGLSFVATDGHEPPGDTLVTLGSPLVLAQHQPTEIIVHNRLDFPISVHWHGLEVRSRYDGVAWWSGQPGATRPPVAPGDSLRVSITPPRAGTFIYHVHGETGYELTQGLYGPFLVLPPGQDPDPDGDRVFVLAARGAERDAPPVINGEFAPTPERFAPGRPYRLRFIHISPDASKRVRLLRDGEPVLWRPVAKDGADLPTPGRLPRPATVEIGVGETYDFAWMPEDAGVYTLEVETVHYSAAALPPSLQRVAFGVGEVAETALTEAARVPPPPVPSVDTTPVVAMSEEELRRLEGVYSAPGVPLAFTVAMAGPELTMSATGQAPGLLEPLGDGVFRWADPAARRAGRPLPRVSFTSEPDGLALNVFGMMLQRTGR